jgi:hypothetical protein
MFPSSTPNWKPDELYRYTDCHLKFSKWRRRPVPSPLPEIEFRVAFNLRKILTQTLPLAQKLFQSALSPDSSYQAAKTHRGKFRIILLGPECNLGLQLLPSGDTLPLHFSSAEEKHFFITALHTYHPAALFQLTPFRPQRGKSEKFARSCIGLLDRLFFCHDLQISILLLIGFSFS